EDVTFLVRENRARQLADGLRIEGPSGDVTVPVKVVTPGQDVARPDIIMVACKAYGLTGAMEAIAPHIRSETVILPVLNGLNHVPLLASRFSEAYVWGGVAHIGATLAPDGTVRHLNELHRLTVGPRGDDGTLVLAERFAEAGGRAGYDSRLSRDIVQELWDKWVFLASLAAATTLVRASVGRIVSTDAGERLTAGLLDEVASIAVAVGHRPAEDRLATARRTLTDRNSGFTASMLRDMAGGGATEADHVIGDLIRRAAAHGVATPLLDVAWVNLQAYEAGREG
ncbi:MAG TPA: 2-dehydropantoate 2-reductase, partial [Paracoccaceae bacterium]|nr:2-dehydropantoate 2-reductase [Paracoccaceae bacterium]